jgi:hypothetical protein
MFHELLSQQVIHETSWLMGHSRRKKTPKVAARIEASTM